MFYSLSAFVKPQAYPSYLRRRAVRFMLPYALIGLAILLPAAKPAASPAPNSAQRARSSASMTLGARMRSGVCAWVQTIMPGAICFSRQPVAMRSTWRSALLPSLPAQIMTA